MSNKLVRNERRKLTASYVNGIALALVGIGVFAQVVAFAQALSVTTASVLVMLSCSLASLILHWSARNVLGGLEE